MVFSLRILSAFEFLGDVLMWVCRLIPTFPVVNCFYLEAVAAENHGLRKYTKENDNGTAQLGDGNVWSIYNCSGDFAMMMLQLSFWTAMIFMIELE